MKWQEAMQKEFSALTANETWESVELPPGKKLTNCKWIYKIRCKVDGTFERYKARLVIRDFT